MFGELKYTSARATPELVGRKEILAQIEQAIRDVPHAYLIDIQGGGGIGKTRVVNHVLGRLAPALDLAPCVAKYSVDLYHTRNHSREGLLENLYLALGGTEREFPNYLEARQALQRISDLAELSKQRDALVNAFLADLNKIGKEQRLVFALDTTERLFFESDPIQQRLGLEEEKIAILNWLLRDFLPHIQNAVILLSGRAERGSLRPDLQKIEGKKFLPIDLQGLTEEEALEYFDAVVRACEEPGELQDLEAAKFIQKLSPDQRRVIFYSLCDATQDTLTIRPIWLALAIDYWVVSREQLLPEWAISLQDARKQATQDHTATRDALGKKLGTSLREKKRMADEVILALGLAPKGADADLLFHILGVDKTEIERALRIIRHLSFVKIRPTDERYFLHDEMYAILERHGLGLNTSEKRAKEVLEKIADWYNARIDNHRKKIITLYERHEKTFYATPEVIQERLALQDAWVEDLHYQLRLDPRRGFETYFRYSDDAIAAGNEALDAQLRSELLAFWRTHDPNWEKEDIQGLRRADVEADAAIRWVKRLIEGGNKPRARQIIERLRSDASDLIQLSGVLAEIALDVNEAHADAYEAKLGEAEEKLKRQIQELGRISRSLVRDGILARAHNHLGYVYRSTGRYLGAIHHYEQARSMWRKVKIEGEQANTLTNLAFALAMIGEFGDAWRQGLDARDLRLVVGAPAFVGMALTALARIAIEENALDDSLRYLQQALPLFTEMQYARGLGLALIAQAETKRRMSTWMDYYPGQTAEQLAQAAQDAEQAIKIFEQIVEPARTVEALIEKGCAYRDWVKFLREKSAWVKDDERGSVPVWSPQLAKSCEAFEEAQRVAEKYNLHYLRADALVNLAWLYYYAGQESDTLQSLERAGSIIPQEYRIKPYQQDLGDPSSPDDEKEKEREKEAIIPFLTQLGKMELLRGQIAFNRYAQSRDTSVRREAIKDAIRHYTLAMAYDTQFRTQEFRDLRRAKDRMYERLKVLNAEEMRLVYDTVEEVQREFHLDPSAMRAFLKRNFGAKDDFASE